MFCILCRRHLCYVGRSRSYSQGTDKTDISYTFKEILQELRSELKELCYELKDQRISTNKQFKKLRIQMVVNTVVVGMVAGGMSLVVAQALREWLSSVQEFEE